MGGTRKLCLAFLDQRKDRAEVLYHSKDQITENSVYFFTTVNCYSKKSYFNYLTMNTCKGFCYSSMIKNIIRITSLLIAHRVDGDGAEGAWILT